MSDQCCCDLHLQFLGRVGVALALKQTPHPLDTLGRRREKEVERQGLKERHMQVSLCLPCEVFRSEHVRGRGM